MEQPPPKSSWKTALVFVAMGFLAAALGASSWLYRSRLQNVPPREARAPQEMRPTARILAAPQGSITPGTGSATEPSSSPNQVPARPHFQITLDPMEPFHEDLRKAVLHELAPAFPELQSVLSSPTAKSADPAYSHVVFRLLDAVKKASADQRPAILLAADLVAQEIWCPSEGKQQCDQIRSEFARYKLSLEYSELDGGFYYPRDLLGRIWRDYPGTDWGERTFVLLLDQGWDTSHTCGKGADQFREVIRQGESFLRQRPSSPYRGVVTLLVAQAYTTWWSLSNETGNGGMSDYVDAERYREGAEEARLKAIGYFEQVLQMVPETQLNEYARRVLPPLREQQVLDNYRFFCVYD
jgi:hypothetical protein